MSDRGSYAIVWDLDETLGMFRSLHGLRADHPERVEIQLRPGLRDALFLLSREGFLHVVLSTASRPYIELALAAGGIRDCFRAVAGRGEQYKGEVGWVAELGGTDQHEIPDRILFVGDREVMDRADDPRIVFHLEPFATRRPAADLARLVLGLRETGNGSLRGGFDRTLRRSAPLWRRALRRHIMGQPVRVDAGPLGELFLLQRPRIGPLVAFSSPPLAEPEVHSVVPGTL